MKPVYLLQLFFPPRCVLCGELIKAEDEDNCFCDKCRVVWEQEKAALCPVCRRDAGHCGCEPKYNRSATVDGFRALTFYQTENVKKLIYTLKTKGNSPLYKMISRELALAVMKYSKVDDQTVLTYPERSRASVKKYGVDQAKTVCRAVSKLTGIPYAPFIKHKSGAEQKKLSAKERGENAAASYTINQKRKDEIKGRHIIFIDDVVTTGATSVVCAALCKAEGAKSFTVYSVAKTPDLKG